MNDDVPETGHRVRFEPSGLTFEARPGEPLLEAARRAGIAIRSACRNGVCEICAGRLKAGPVYDQRRDRLQADGEQVLLCRAEARGDLVIQIEEVMAAGSYPAESVMARVLAVTALNHDVFRVGLRLPPGRSVKFHAGQYLAINLPDAEPAWFSIASSPLDNDIELHIQAASDWVTAQGVMDYLRREGRAPLQLPFGRACLARRPERPLILVAAGTGFAQMKSILEYLHSTGNDDNAGIALYWGVRIPEDMYLRSLPEQWQRDWPGFNFHPVVGDCEDNDWQGHHDQLIDAVLAGGHDWPGVDVIASGSPTMVYTLMDALIEAGLPPERFQSDVLEYAPR